MSSIIIEEQKQSNIANEYKMFGGLSTQRPRRQDYQPIDGTVSQSWFF